MANRTTAPDPQALAQPGTYILRFLTEEWEWEEDCAARSPEHAKIAAREALVNLVRAERPELACVALMANGVRLGVWDWVDTAPYWTGS